MCLHFFLQTFSSDAHIEYFTIFKANDINVGPNDNMFKWVKYLLLKTTRRFFFCIILFCAKGGNGYRQFYKISFKIGPLKIQKYFFAIKNHFYNLFFISKLYSLYFRILYGDWWNEQRLKCFSLMLVWSIQKKMLLKIEKELKWKRRKHLI